MKQRMRSGSRMGVRAGFHAGVVATLATATLTVGAIAPAHAQLYGVSTVVANGLANPRHMVIGPDGGLYVTEAGSGGTGSTITDGAGTMVSYGTTSGITRILGGAQSRVLSGAPSLATQAAVSASNPGGPGSGASGLHDMVFVGNQAYGIIGYGANPSLRGTAFATSETGASLLGRVVSLDLSGTNAITSVADPVAFEAANNPDGADLNSNAYGLAIRPGGGFLVADAGANTLLATSGSTVSLLTTFPARPNPLPFGPPFYQSVPTAVRVGADGAYYVSELSGFPYLPGSSNIYRYDPTNGQRTVAYSGFTNLVDFGFTSTGDLYALQIDSNGLAAQNGPGLGVLYRVNGTTGQRSNVSGLNLITPTGLVVASDNSVYVTNLGTSGSAGQVLRVSVSAAPEAGSATLLVIGLVGLVGITVRRRARKNA